MMKVYARVGISPGNRKSPELPCATSFTTSPLKFRFKRNQPTKRQLIDAFRAVIVEGGIAQ